MLFITSFLILIIPAIFQIIFGNKSLNKKIKPEFIIICALTAVLQFIVTIASVIIAIFAITEDGNKCATGAVGMIAISFFISIFVLLIIFFQIGIQIEKKYIENKKKKANA